MRKGLACTPIVAALRTEPSLEYDRPGALDALVAVAVAAKAMEGVSGVASAVATAVPSICEPVGTAFLTAA